MKLPEVVELVENHPDLHLYLDKILKKNKKTQVKYSWITEPSGLFTLFDGQEEMAKELLDRIIQVPFEGNYNTLDLLLMALWLYWPISEREAENQVIVYKSFYLH